MPPQRVGFVGRFGLKMGTFFAHFGPELDIVFKRTMGLYDRIYCFNSN